MRVREGMKIKKVTFATAYIFSFFTPFSQAKIEAQAFVTDSGLAITPYYTVAYKYDDNLALVKEGKEKESSDILMLNGGLKFQAERGLDKYALSYFIKTGTYSNSSDDNYVDHELKLLTHFDISERNRLSFKYLFIDEHESRGSGLTEGRGERITEPARYQRNDVSGRYSYGSLKGQGRIKLDLSFDTKDYTNYKNVTKYSNYERFKYALTYSHKISSASEFFVELSRAEKRFDEYQFISADNDDHFIYLGASWEISGKTTGYTKLGYENKQFKDDEREDFSGFSWDMGFNFFLSEYSQLKFKTSSAAKDPEQDGDYLQESKAHLAWEHYWLKRFSSEVFYSYIFDDYVGNAQKREDDTQQLRLTLAYDFSPWLELRTGYKYEDKTSSLAAYGYEQNIYFLHFNGTI